MSKTFFLDTNIIVRLLTNDPPDLARRVANFIDSQPDSRFVLNDLIIAEVVYVLESFYNVNKSTIADKLSKFFTIPNVKVEGQEVVEKALGFYNQNNIDYAEAYLTAYALKKKVKEILSFDKDLDKIKDIKRMQP